MSDLRAVIFDVDGTLADTERDGHRPAFNAAFARHGLDIHWDPDHYGRLLEIAGGEPRIAADLRERGFGERSATLATEIHKTKTGLFRDAILAGAVEPRAGLPELVADLRSAGIGVAVATTGRRAWVSPLVDRLIGPVEVMVTAEDVGALKPDPEAYLVALQRLGLGPGSAMAVEDSANGLRAALGAGLATVVVTNDYTRHQDFTGAAVVLPDYHTVPLTAAEFRRLHGESRGGI